MSMYKEVCIDDPPGSALNMNRPWVKTPILTLIALLCLTGCDGQQPTTAPSSPGPTHFTVSHFGPGKDITVGLKPDQPQISLQNGADFDGFEKRLAKYITDNTGTGVGYSPVVTKNREDILQKDGPVHMIVATYSDTPDRRSKVQFVGPYIQTPQGVLVRDGDKEKIQKTADLKGKSVCTTEESTSQHALEAIGVSIKTKTHFAECVEFLENEQVDAVSTDLLILYGYQETSSKVVVAKDKGENPVEIPATTQNKWMIGLHPGNKEDCRVVLAQLKAFMSNGTWERYFTTWFQDVQDDYDDWSTRFKPEIHSVGCVGKT